MKLVSEFIKLPLYFDAASLAAEVAEFDESAWRPHPQGHPGNSALALIAVGGDADNDAVKGPMRPTRHLERCPYLRQVLASFGTVLGRTRLMRLDGNAEATPHSDTNYYWLRRVRIHVPVLTHPTVEFICGERRVHMAAGESWIFDTWLRHNVINAQASRRIHLVVDSVGSDAFWNLAATPSPRFMPFEPNADAALELESVNFPVVMSPWEQRALLDDLLTDFMPDAESGTVVQLRAELERFQRDWQALWARFGTSAQGWPSYRERLERLDARLKRYPRRLRLANGVEATEAIRQMTVRAALNPELAHPPHCAAAKPGATIRTTVEPAPAAVPSKAGSAKRFTRPIFIVSPPRSGSSLLFETLALSPSVWTIGRESHAQIEGIEALNPRNRGFDSNCLAAADATPDVLTRLEQSFFSELRDRAGRAPPPGASGLRLLEKTPKNALRVPFLAASFPDAVFIYLYRDPRDTISSMLDAWRSGRFVMYPKLPGWTGPPWSMLLTPGWRALNDCSLAEIVAAQWKSVTCQLLDDLQCLPPHRWCVAGYDRLLQEAQAEVERLCRFIGIEWDRSLNEPLPLSRHTLTPPRSGKWRKNAAELEVALPLVAQIAERAREIFAHPPAFSFGKGRSAAISTTASTAVPPLVEAGKEADSPLKSVYTANLPKLFKQLGLSLLVSTYQSGRVIAVRADGDQLNTHFRSFESPMGMAIGPNFLALGTARHVWKFRNVPAVARKIDPPGKHDACYLPSAAHVTGDIRIHELAFAGAELWLVNTRFSCLCTLEDSYSFVPRWWPRFVSRLAAEDRCHMNGLVVIDERVRYVTALGETDTAAGWRDNKASGGVLIDVASGDTVLRGLCMPHSPRWHDGRLWLLESGKGALARVDLARGRVETVAQLPGFTRGLAFAGPYAFVGLSQVRESVFSGIPLTERLSERVCGVWVIDLRNARTAGFLRFEGSVQEIFDVLALPGIRFPEISEANGELIAGAYVLPDAALRYSVQTD